MVVIVQHSRRCTQQSQEEEGQHGSVVRCAFVSLGHRSVRVRHELRRLRGQYGSIYLLINIQALNVPEGIAEGSRAVAHVVLAALLQPGATGLKRRPGIVTTEGCIKYHPHVLEVVSAAPPLIESEEGVGGTPQIRLRRSHHQINGLLPLREEPGAHDLPVATPMCPLSYKSSTSILVEFWAKGSVRQFLTAALVGELLRSLYPAILGLVGPKGPSGPALPHKVNAQIHIPLVTASACMEGRCSIVCHMDGF
mmetsp:Transcript_67808/g.148845  ORF Transcript_67808/g.148845 Transcript_67808/m.148845 type:complete len:252 (-) Transcript_67808:468-1223(-)